MIVARQTSTQNKPNPRGVKYVTPLGFLSKQRYHFWLQSLYPFGVGTQIQKHKKSNLFNERMDNPLFEPFANNFASLR